MRLTDSNKDEAFLYLDNVSVVYNKGTINEVYALKNCDLKIKKGELVFVVGSNGSGKSTLLNAISKGYVTSGKIYLDGKQLNGIPEYVRANEITKVEQNLDNAVVNEFSIEDNFLLAMIKGNKLSFSTAKNRIRKKQIIESLAKLDMGLENRLNHLASNLSGGQKQALALAMALYANKPKLLLFDEPTSSTDERISKLIETMIFNSVIEDKITALWVTHNIEQTQKNKSRIIKLIDGSIQIDINHKKHKY